MHRCSIDNFSLEKSDMLKLMKHLTFIKSLTFYEGGKFIDKSQLTVRYCLIKLQISKKKAIGILNSCQIVIYN